MPDMVKSKTEMKPYTAEDYDLIVIGGGHAGCEAALAGARLGVKTAIFTINLDGLANLPCNPCIGGTSKGHLVREIDALGGEIGKITDKTFIQSRILNKGKGPAVYSLRAQVDRRLYQLEMKYVLEEQENLRIKQDEIAEILVKDGKVCGVVTKLETVYSAKAVIISTGTYLKGSIIIGNHSYESGPDGLFPSNKLSECLKKLGLSLMRFKTGTPCRIDAKTVDFSKMEIQEGDELITPFSFETDYKTLKNQVRCYLTYTNENTHKLILDNLDKAPMYSGLIEGVGPRYCPSIEDKVVRFKNRPAHQIFIEPLGLKTNEMYVQGLSTSMPEEIQIKMLRTIKGLENVEITRNAYAIEYDCIDSTQLRHTLEFKSISGLYGAGQFNGSSGYEEAAAQGIVAGINAALKIQGKKELIIDRSEAYIGTLIDDLVTKGTNEPYRMLTSLSEYRLYLRQDNADFRLTPIGYKLGLISEERYNKFLAKKKKIEDEIKRLGNVIISPTESVNEFLAMRESATIKTGIKLVDLLKRPELSYSTLGSIDVDRPNLEIDVCEQVEISIKYEGYIKRQFAQIEQFKKLEKKKLFVDIDYEKITGLRLAARQKLNKIKPESIGQASRISGVSPADITVLLIYLEQNKR